MAQQYHMPYACTPSNSKGRLFKEKEDPYRTSFQRDRDRILYSTAFRRMQYKTQVYVTHEADFYRTRLTHTLEVMQHARTIARILKANEDLVEAVSLAHDLGHAPFGHGGEEELNGLMDGFGGFDHNLQSLRIVDQLEKRYLEFKGLNLCYETREGLARHVTDYDKPKPHEDFQEFPSPSLETQIVNWADPLAFSTHDLDDALNAGLISIQDLEDKNIPTVNKHIEKLKLNLAKGNELEFEIRKKLFIRNLIEDFTVDVIKYTQSRLELYKPECPDDLRLLPAVVSMNPVVKEDFDKLRDVLYSRVYRHPNVLIMVEKGKKIIRDLFHAFAGKPQLLPWVTQRKWEEAFSKEERLRVICDYISGMTDRFAMETYNRLFEPNEKVML
ncbi:MAG: deoxyguanosinetriphosphate triphosphohydrolase [Dethiobacter sp.]|jgi:dGTPase|nr:MAG: deoxyguanosinetriphosphate triphosphohydrolase [Dethiobacter sp.]